MSVCYIKLLSKVDVVYCNFYNCHRIHVSAAVWLLLFIIMTLIMMIMKIMIIVIIIIIFIGYYCYFCQQYHSVCHIWIIVCGLLLLHHCIL